jgi:hypothetical protein
MTATAVAVNRAKAMIFDFIGVLQNGLVNGREFA